MLYINYKYNGHTNAETLFEYENTDRQQAEKDLAEYRASDPHGRYWLSTRAARSWMEGATAAPCPHKSAFGSARVIRYQHPKTGDDLPTNAPSRPLDGGDSTHP